MEKNEIQKYNISKVSLEEIIFDELFAQEKFNANQFHKTIVKLLAEELYESALLDDNLESLKEKEIFKNLKIEDKDIKRIAIDNIIIGTIENSMEEIDRDYNLMPLAYIKYHHIKEEHIYNIIQKLKPQIKNIISPEIKEEAKIIAKEAFEDGKVFDNLIMDIELLIAQENNKDNIRMYQKNKLILEEYRKEESLKILIEDVSEQIKEKQTSHILNEEIEEDDTLYEHIDNTSKNIQLSAKEIEESITYDKSYKSITSKVPVDEFCGLININSYFSKRRTK